MLAERFRDEAALRDAVGARAEALMYAGRHFESALLASARLDLARRAGSAVQQAQAAMALGVIVAEDDPRASLDAFRESVDVSRRLGLRLYELLGHSNLAETAVDLGEWAAADEALAAGRRSAASRAARPTRAWCSPLRCSRPTAGTPTQSSG